jgi:hypothetical protein
MTKHFSNRMRQVCFHMYMILVVCLMCKYTIAEEALVLTDVCINNCTGHGSCLNFVCDCFIGYFGDDCRLSFAPNSKSKPQGESETNGGDEIIPILGAGHYNLTTKNFTKIVDKTPIMVVGFSSVKCHKCIIYEPEYAKAAIELKKLGVPFARANGENFRNVLKDLNSVELPALVVYRKGDKCLFLEYVSLSLSLSLIKSLLNFTCLLLFFVFQQ